MSEYKLAILTQNKEKKDIKDIRTLCESEYLKYKEAQFCIQNFSKTQELITSIHVNQEEYKILDDKVRNTFIKNGFFENGLRDAFIMDLNRLLLNYLSSMSAFLDHARKRLSNESSKKNLNNFDEECSRYYDNYFSYKFIYFLRNYTQHQENPIRKFETYSYIDKTNNEQIVRKILIGINRDNIINAPKIKNPLKEELLKQPDYIDIMQHILKMTEILKELNVLLIAQKLPGLVTSVDIIDNLIKETLIKSPEGLPCIFLLDNQTIRPEIKFKLNFLPVEEVNLLKQVFL
jgi:hypothetical protein